MSAKIVALREAAHLTQRQLAEQVGVTETTIANWEQGRSSLDWLDRLGRLCLALDCNLVALIQVVDGSIVPCITSLRERRGLTQRQLAEQVGVTETTIANWERGRSGLDWIERLIRLCSALNCQISDLVEPQPQVSQMRSSLAELLSREAKHQPKTSQTSH